MARLTPALTPAFDPEPMDPRLSALLEGYPGWLFGESLYGSIELMERYSIDLAIDALDGLRVLSQLEDWRSAFELCRSSSFKPGFRFALAWLMERLVEPGCIEVQADECGTRRYRLRRTPWKPELTRLRELGLAIDPANARTLDLLDRAASAYPAVARGEVTGEQGLFGVDGIPLWLNYFHNANPTYAVNNWVGALAAAERLAGRARLRILEAGAGAGSASECLLRVLGERGLLPRVERYVVTEPNAFFRRRGQRELQKLFDGLPLAWQPLDIDRSWKAQGVAPGGFDLVFGVNVVHVAKDLLFSLGEARAALARDGWLVMGECLRPYPHQPIYAELMFQILDGFTEVATDHEFRPNPGFLTAQQWRRALARVGLTSIAVAPEVERIGEIYPHFFTGAICARPDPDDGRSLP